METTAKQSTALPRALSPQAAGISRKALAELLQDMLDQSCALHSIMVLRHGQVAYEDFRLPYGPEEGHTLFSVSKSFTSIAVGFAVAEGLFRLEDKVADLIPELRDYDSHENLEKLQVRHLVSMSSGKGMSLLVDRTKKQWIRDFGEAQWDYVPGEGWHYCNENIYMLCAIIHRLSGECVVDFLMPRLFEPLGIDRPFWETDGCGIEAGGWGLYLKTEDLAKVGQCYLNGGVYGGRQVIPAEWVRDSAALQCDTSNNCGEDGPVQGKQGYGYCFWRNTAPGGYRMDGMFSQFVLIFPEYDACVVTTAGERDMDKFYWAMFRHIPAIFADESESAPAEDTVELPRLPAFEPLPAAPRNSALEARLNRHCIRYLPLLQPAAKAIGFPPGITPAMIFYMSADKAGGIDKMHLRFGEDGLRLSWSEGQERNTVLCGMDGRWRRCRITLGGVPFLMACSAAWEGDCLQIHLRNLSSVAQRMLSLRFSGRRVHMTLRSDPGLETMVDDAAKALRTSVPNKALGNFLAEAMGKVVQLAEPPHLGILR